MPENSGKPFKLSGFAVKFNKENGIAITGEGAFEVFRACGIQVIFLHARPNTIHK